MHFRHVSAKIVKQHFDWGGGPTRVPLWLRPCTVKSENNKAKVRWAFL